MLKSNSTNEFSRRSAWIGTVSIVKAEPDRTLYDGNALFHNMRPLPDDVLEKSEPMVIPPAPSVCNKKPSVQ